MSVKTVSFFSTEVFSGKAILKFIDPREETYQQTALLTLSCLASVGSRVLSMIGRNFNQYIDLGKLGSNLGDPSDYWELVTTIQTAKESFKTALQLLGYVEAKDGDQPSLKKVSLLALKTLSNGVNFIGCLHGANALSGFAFTPLKMVGSLAGAIYFLNKTFEDYYKKPEEPMKIQGFKKRAKAIKSTYKKIRKEQAEWQATWQHRQNLALNTSVLALKTISFISSAYTLYGGPRFAQPIVNYQNGLLLTSFAVLMTSIVGGHFLKEQMEVFNNQITQKK